MKKKYYIYIFLAKFSIATIFLWYTIGLQGLDRLGLMIDQIIYLYDIDDIESNIGMLIDGDDKYSANRTLYSRVLGLVAWLIPLDQSPIVIAVYMNTIFHLLIAFVSTKIFEYFGGIRVALFYFVVAFSPTYTVYSFFALRDILISLVTIFFIWQLLVRAPLKMIAATIAIVFLRPFFVAVFGFWLVLDVCFNFVRKNWRRIPTRIVSVVLSISILLTFGFLINNNFAPESVRSSSVDTIDFPRFVINVFGLETFFTEAEGRRASRSMINNVRVIMFDSVLLPISMLLMFCFSVINRNGKILYLSSIALVMMIFITFTYLTITDKFAFRKLLPLLPFMWVCVFVWLDERKYNKNGVSLGY